MGPSSSPPAETEGQEGEGVQDDTFVPPGTGCRAGDMPDTDTATLEKVQRLKQLREVRV
ncbi:MAG: hypothetical protein ACPIOQ_78840 [Promethearchaeia archaeon]